MEKIICDICGSDYPETEIQCPVCGCAKGDNATTVAGNSSEEEQAFAFVKGGRFSKSNVRRRLNSDQQPKRTAPAIVPDDEEEEDELPQSNRGLIIVVIVLLLAIIAVSTYIAVMFFGKTSPADPTAPGQSSTITTGNVDCSSIALETLQITLSELGASKQIGYTLIPINTTDRPVFTAEDPAIVSVDSTGKVTALAAGTTTITIVCGDEQAKITVVCDFVDPNAPTTQPVVKPTLPQNSNFTVPADATPVEAYQIIVTNSYVNIRKAPTTSVDNKVGTANMNDKLTVIATYYADDLDWGLTEKGWVALKYTKRADGSSAVPGGDALKLNRSDFTLTKTDSKWNLYSGALDPTQIVWNSGNTSVVTVKDGVVTAVGNGNTEITAEYNGQMVSCKVYVTGF